MPCRQARRTRCLPWRLRRRCPRPHDRRCHPGMSPTPVPPRLLPCAADARHCPLLCRRLQGSPGRVPGSGRLPGVAPRPGPCRGRRGGGGGGWPGGLGARGAEHAAAPPPCRGSGRRGEGSRPAATSCHWLGQPALRLRFRVMGWLACQRWPTKPRIQAYPVPLPGTRLAPAVIAPAAAGAPQHRARRRQPQPHLAGHVEPGESGQDRGWLVYTCGDPSGRRRQRLGAVSCRFMSRAAQRACSGVCALPSLCLRPQCLAVPV